MRATLTTRTVVAVASLAIGSAALAAVPAGAATPSGITRDQILTAAAGVRAAPPGTIGFSLFGGGSGFGPAANRALRAMVNRVCVTDPDGPEVTAAYLAAATAGGASADGVVVTVYMLNSETAPTTSGRICTFGALAPVAGSSVLTGTATISGAAPVALSGDAFVTPAVNTPFSGSSPEPGTPTFSASGNAVQSVTVKIKDKKTSKQKKAAKKTYTKRLKAAKKSYAKSLDKAGSSKAKKTAAKKAYKAKVKSAKATYRYRIANYKLKTNKVPTPFNISAQITPIS